MKTIVENLASNLRFIGRTPLALALVISYLLVLKLFPMRRSVIQRKWSRAFLWLCGIEVQVLGENIGSGTLVVSNHLGWLDPLALLSQAPLSFVTSTDVQNDVFLGSLCTQSGCAYVSRKSWSLPQELMHLQTKLQNGESLVFFPEGTSSDGSGILPFRHALFEVSVQCQVPVQPLYLEWALPQVVAYFGSMTFTQSLLRVLRSSRNTLNIHTLPVVNPQNFANRHEIALYCERSITEAKAKQNPNPLE